MLNPDWDIKPRAISCAQCQTPFQDGQDYVSALLFGDEGYQRQDHCVACWAARPVEPTALVSLWRGVFHAPPPPAPQPLNRENVERMLRDLMASNELSRLNVIYILAVILERRRILIEKDVRKRPDGQLTRIYEHRKTGETFLIADPMLDLNQLEHVRREVEELIEGESAPEVPSENDTATGSTPKEPAPTCA